MIKVLFFAKLREELATAEMAVELDSAKSVLGLKGYLSDQGGENWARALTQKNILCAVNQQMVNDDVLLKAGDEVAFFPPVTGG